MKLFTLFVKQADEEVQTEGDAVEVIDVFCPRAASHPFQEVARVDQEDPWLDHPFPDYDTEPVMAFSAT